MEESTKLIITCPGCQKEISIDEALKQRLVESEKLKVESEYTEKLEAEKKKMWAIALEKAQEKTKEKIEEERRSHFALQATWDKKAKELELELESQRKKREEAEAVELKLRKEKIDFEEDKKRFELEKQRQLDLEREKMREEISKSSDEAHRLKEAELLKKLSDAQKLNEDLDRKLKQGSQQTQGEVLEIELEESLKTEFPVDEIAPVPKGINGADITQTIRDQRGRPCGAIAWELKRTKAWTEGWVQKLKDDQRKVKAEIAVLVSEVLPSGVKDAGYYSGIYVATPKMAISLAGLLRRQIIEVAGVMALEEGKSEKKDVVFNYLLGPEFRGRIESFIEAAIAMRKSLDQEKRAYTRMWAEREKLIGRIETSMSGLYGEIKGIAGNSLPGIKSLELPGGEEEDITEEEVVAIIEEPVKDEGIQQLSF
ncbi:MAG TPA: DUF2130 domain-containing protein [bacterium]|mgnify:CR=1 FL=1|nr:DUF2130 domain-containing protein [bacterium]